MSGTAAPAGASGPGAPGPGTPGPAATAPPRDALRANALGPVAIVFLVVSAAAPLAAAVGALPVVFIGNGVGAPGMFVVATLLSLLFSVGYAAISRYVTSAGGFAAYIARSVGPRAGVGAAFAAVFSYNAALIGVCAYFGVFAHDTMADKLAIDLPWQAWTFGALAIIAVLGYFDINLTAKVIGLLMLLEVAVLLILDVAILAKGGQGGINLDGFSPSSTFSGSPGIAFIFAFLSFLGFEATALYGEEAREPKKTVPRATYVAVLVIGGFYLLTAWAATIGYGSDAVGAAAVKDPAGFIFGLSDRYVGAWLTDAMQILVLTSFFATLLAFHNNLARYVYSLGRANVMAPALGRTHDRHRSPFVASIAESAVCIGVLALFAVLGADPFTVVYSWLSGVSALGTLALEIVVSIGVILFFARTGLDRRAWHAKVAPALAAAGLAVGLYLALSNYKTLAGVSTGWVFAIPAALPVVALLGWALARAKERRGERLSAGIDGGGIGFGPGTSGDGDAGAGAGDGAGAGEAAGAGLEPGR